MALNDIPKFQAAVSEDLGLQEQLKSVVKSMTAGVGMPLSADSNIDWSPVTDIAKGLGFDFSVEEIKEALFGGGRELSEDELDAAVGAAGLFSLASFGDLGSKTGFGKIKGGLKSDTVHGVGDLGSDTIHGVGKDTIHGNR